MRHLVAVCIISCLAINPALANKFAACGFIETKHPKYDCTGAGVGRENDLFGIHVDDPKTGKKYSDIVLDGKECSKIELEGEYTETGHRLMRKKVGKLYCDPQTGRMKFNNSPLYFK